MNSLARQLSMMYAVSSRFKWVLIGVNTTPARMAPNMISSESSRQFLSHHGDVVALGYTPDRNRRATRLAAASGARHRSRPHRLTP